jgi:bacteriocin biosynthesis cyclodehydratase domain-containing protein
MNSLENKGAKPIHVLAAGPFGEKTGSILRDLVPGLVITSCTTRNAINPSFWPNALVHVVVAWRPVRRLLELVNRMSYAWRTPLVAAVIEEPELVIGPAIIPGLSACYNCYERRSLQHCERSQARAALLDHYDLNPVSGPTGYLNVFSDLTAVRLAQMVQQVESEPRLVAGKVWRFDMMRRQAAVSTVVGVHGCSYCGLQRDESTRSYAELRTELAALLHVEPADELLGTASHDGIFVENLK